MNQGPEPLLFSASRAMAPPTLEACVFRPELANSWPCAVTDHESGVMHPSAEHFILATESKSDSHKRCVRALLAKYSQNETARRALLGTGDAALGDEVLSEVRAAIRCVVVPWEYPVHGEHGVVAGHGDDDLTYQTFVDTPSYIVGIAHQRPNSDHAGHYHEPAEVFICVGGGGETERRDGSWASVGVGDAVLLPSHAVHHTRAGPHGLVVLWYFPKGPLESIKYRRPHDPETCVDQVPSEESPSVTHLSLNVALLAPPFRILRTHGEILSMVLTPRQSCYVHRGVADVDGYGVVLTGGLLYIGPEGEERTVRVRSVGAEPLELCVVAIAK